jgi:hypothetical protein
MALVITLIMLAVVTLMAVTFLALSRRERASITATVDLTAAKLAADAGAARAQAEVIAQVAVRSNRFAYDLSVSTNLIRMLGFDSTLAPGTNNFTNVSYTYANGARLNQNDLLKNLTNLWYDARPPVFVVTNSSLPLDSPLRSEFRYYLDLNRNGMFDTNGLQPIVTNGRWSATNLGYFIGDPEWVGILENPDQPHSPSNLFVGRYAYIALPAGKSLDLNFVHNSAKNLNLGSAGPVPEGFWRNQGFGSWELNLAAFFQTWLPAFYDPYQHVTNLASPSGSRAFLDALEILRYRYRDTRADLKTVAQQYGNRGAQAFQNDRIDGYSDGGLVLTNRLLESGAAGDPADTPTRPWPGSDNVAGYYSPQELFDNAKVDRDTALNPDLADRLGLAGVDVLYSSNRFAFTRLLSQMGTDSLPANRSKLNLNYDNVTPTNGVASATNFLPWASASTFFTNAADRLLRHRFPAGLTDGAKAGLGGGIEIYPTNYYSPEVHRLLQLAANLGDALTNRVMLTTNLAAPSVFRPLLTRTNESGVSIVKIVGYQEIFSPTALNDPWREVTNVPTGPPLTDLNVFGVPWIVGVKKGLPNFNEFQLQNTALVTRRLRAQKRTADDRNPTYQQSWSLTISNHLGAEVWNSYARAFPLPLNLWLTNRCSVWLRDANSNAVPLARSVLRTNELRLSTNYSLANFAGGRFEIPLNHLLQYVPESTYHPADPVPLRPLNGNAIQFDSARGYPVPEWKLELTNSFIFALTATAADGTRRIVDVVNLDPLRASLDIAGALGGTTNQPGGGRPPPPRPGAGSASVTLRPDDCWSTNRSAPLAMTLGISNQIYASSYSNGMSSDGWQNYSLSVPQRDVAIQRFRMFLGLDPDTRPPAERRDLTMMVPYTPAAKLVQTLNWQANDPLVHYHPEDLTHTNWTSTNIAHVLKRPPSEVLTNSDLGMINKRYSPWGGREDAGGRADNFAFNPAVKDPLIWTSDSWDFPTMKFPSLGWLGRVHRGTPWQTVYLKSAAESGSSWIEYAGGLNPRWRHPTHPTNDWPLLELFTVAPNDNASRGLLSVNQTNEAAWAAVLCGVTVLTNSQASPRSKSLPRYGYEFIEPNSWQFTNIVYSINSNRVARGGTFKSLGEVLSSPALTVSSPYLNTTETSQRENGITDAVYERIPQQILSLLKEDEPYVVIYSYGQSLKPADRSRITAPGTYFNLCTNYQITGEVLTKTAVRLEEIPGRGSDPNTYRGIIESYNLLPTD